MPLELADIVRAEGATYRTTHRLSERQLRALRSIEQCRTAELGGHLERCGTCPYERPAYNSCRNRHCPKCLATAQRHWIDQRLGRILPVPYVHVVFTVPSALHGLARANPSVVYALLFAAASETLLELGRSRFGARLGITMVLHTWTRELAYHPHVHCIVTAGGYDPVAKTWVASRPGFLFPVHVLSRLMRGAMLAGLRKARRDGQLHFRGPATALKQPGGFQALCETLWATNWVVYAKAPFGGAPQVYRYLGRYTHRVAISNRRLRAFDGARVTFSTRGRDTMTLDVGEFLRRFLLHVLPYRFVKIRHYGLFASRNVATLLAEARAVLDPSAPSAASRAAPSVPTDALARLTAILGADLTVCPACGGLLVREPLPVSRGPPPVAIA